MHPATSSKSSAVTANASQRRALAGDMGVCASGGLVAAGRSSWELARTGNLSGSACGRRVSRAVRVAGCGCSVGASGTERKPLASLGLGLTAALRVRPVRVGGAGRRLVSHTTALRYRHTAGVAETAPAG